MDSLNWFQILLLLAGAGLIFAGLLWGICKLHRKYWAYQQSLDFVFLFVRTPKKDSKEDYERERDQTQEIRRVIGVGRQFLDSLYGLTSSNLKNRWLGQKFVSLEWIAHNNQIYFVIGCPQSVVSFVEKQITSLYPEAVIEQSTLPKMFQPDHEVVTGYLTASRSEEYPFVAYDQFESSDPVNNILNALAGSSDEEGRSAGIQLMIRPRRNGWQKAVLQKAQELKTGKSKGSSWNPFYWLGRMLNVLFQGTENQPGSAEDSGPKDAESQELIKAMEARADQVGFETIIRCVASAPTESQAEREVTNLLSAFTQYGGPSINSFKKRLWYSKQKFLYNYLLRIFGRSWIPQNKILLTPSELAGIFHFPHIKYNKVPTVSWQNFKLVKTPANIPKEGLLLGHNQYRNERTPIYMKREDRFRHFYVIGQTGTGKSSIFQVMARQDMANGDGMCVVDPHGSLIEDLLPHVPAHRVDDVIIFDPSDLERPMGLNLLEAYTDEERDMVALDAMNIMIKMFDEEIFGPRIQDYFRNGCLTLMADPNGGAITDIVRLFTDDSFQRSKVKHVTNPVVRSFWDNQMASTGAREKQEMIPYFAAKFGSFITNSMMRNIIGQVRSSFDFSQVMNEGKILLMNLSKGTTGDINSSLLGMIIVAKIQMATLRRQKEMKGDRRDFFLYIDEFQNYVTDSIESILSEARKYRLSLNIAHQYISQIDTSNKKKGVNLKDAVFGNVGSIMCYKISAQDAEHMAREMAPAFTEQDLINMDKYKAVMRLSIDTQPSQPFSIVPVNPYVEGGDAKIAKALKQISRLTYGRSKKFVENEILTRLDIKPGDTPAEQAPPAMPPMMPQM